LFSASICTESVQPFWVLPSLFQQTQGEPAPKPICKPIAGLSTLPLWRKWLRTGPAPGQEMYGQELRQAAVPSSPGLLSWVQDEGSWEEGHGRGASAHVVSPGKNSGTTLS
jgi:hypothetical protein